MVVNGTGTHSISNQINAGNYVQNGGTMTFSGSGNNNITTMTTVNDGTLILNKSGYAVSDLTIGNGTNAATVRLDAHNQIQDWKRVVINEGSTLNLNNKDDAFAYLEMTGATLSTGSGTFTLQQGGTNAVQTYASANSSTISGKMHLGGYKPSFNVADGRSEGHRPR